MRSIGRSTFQASLRGKSATQRLRLVASLACLGILLGTLLFWKAELQTEHANLQAEISTTSSVAADHIAHQLRNSVQSLERMADRIKSGMELDKELWARDARNCREDNPSFQAIEWIDKDLKVRWVEPLRGNEKALSMNIRSGARRTSTVNEAYYEGKTSISKSIDLIQGGKGFLVYAPVIKDGKFYGMIAGVYHLNLILTGLPTNIRPDTRLEILEGDTPVFSNGRNVPVGTPAAISRIDFLNSFWSVRATSPTNISIFGSALGVLILCAGFVLTFMTLLVFVSLDKWMTIGSLEEKGRKFLEGMTDSSATSIYVFDFDSRKMIYANRNGYESLGLTEQQVLDGGLPLLKTLVHPEDWPKTLIQFAEVRRLADGEVYTFEHRIKAKNGDWRWLVYRECILERSADGSATRVLLTAHDITDLKDAESQIAQSKSDLEKVFENAPIGMALVSPEGRWIDVNPALCDIVGYCREELLVTDFQTITHPDDLEKDLEKVNQVLSGEIQTYSMEKRYYHKSGHLVWILLCVSLVRYPNGEPRHFVSQIQDISKQKLRELLNQEFTASLVQQTDFLEETNTRLVQESRTDALTGLANRRFFGEHFAQVLQVAQRYDRSLSVIMLDVDHFKGFNDEFGHTSGDLVLQHVAVVLREICRDADFPARWGGEEFIVLCPETDILGAAELAERLRRKVSEIDLPFRAITASFGVASVGADPTTVFERADAALYFAKASGRNCVKLEEGYKAPNQESA